MEHHFSESSTPQTHVDKPFTACQNATIPCTNPDRSGVACVQCQYAPAPKPDYYSSRMVVHAYYPVVAKILHDCTIQNGRRHKYCYKRFYNETIERRLEFMPFDCSSSTTFDRIILKHRRVMCSLHRHARELANPNR